MKNKAQSILEYAIVIGIVGLAIAAMQLYFRRSIQTVVKIASDDVGDQRKGAAEYDYKNEWKWKGASETTSTVNSTKTAAKDEGGVVTYGRDTTSEKTGLLSWGAFTEKE